MGGTVMQRLELAVFRVARSPYRRLRAEICHPHWALSYVVRGEVTTTTGPVHEAAPAGSLMVHPPGLAYAEYAEVPGEHEWLTFSARGDDGVELLAAQPMAPVVAVPRAGWRPAFDQLDAAWHGAGPDRELQVAAGLARLLAVVFAAWRAAGAVPRPATMRPREDRFDQLVTWMGRHLHLPLDRATIARRAGYQANALDRAFRAQYGQPPMALLRELRLRRAQHLLGSGDAGLAAIAEACGFDSASHLGRRFKQRYGVSPGRWRQGVRAAQLGPGEAATPPA